MSFLKNSKTKELLIHSGFSISVKGASLLVSFLSFPIYIDYFDNQLLLGVWFTMFSVLSWILTFDLGIGNGLRQKLVFALEEKNYTKAKEYISSAYAVIAVAVVSISLVGILLFPHINWIKIFNTEEIVTANSLLVKTVRIVFIGMMIQFFLRIVNSIFFALQKPAIPGFLNLLSSLAMLAFLYLSKFEHLEEKLIGIAMVSVFVYNIPILIASILVFIRKLKYSRPNFSFIRKADAIEIIKLGGMFFGLQIMFLMISNTKEFFISWLSSPSFVVDFQMYNKPFLLIYSFFFVALSPVWSLVTAAIANNDILWIKKLTARLQIVAFIAIIGCIMMVFLLQPFLNIWLGDRAIQTNKIYALYFALSSGTFMWLAILSSTLNGMGKIKSQAIFLGIGAGLNVPLAYIFVLVLNSWIGVVIANFLSLLPYCITQTIVLRRTLKMAPKADSTIAQ